MIDIPGMRAGFLAMGSAAVLLAAPGTSLASASADHADHLKSATHEGHDFVYRLFEPSSASTKAVRSGSWSDPTTWSAGVPAAGGRVLIPRDISVTLDSNAVVPMAWIRIDGALDVAPERDTRLDVTTMMVADGGRLSIGGVRNPIEAARTARIYFSPRRGDHKRSDPADISGGLIVFGKFEAHGAGKTAFAIPADRRGLAGARDVTFRDAPAGWRLRDRLLFAASNPGELDEVREIAGVSANGRTFSLSRPLRFDHNSPSEAQAAVPVGNITRNIVFRSMQADRLADRAHIMIATRESADIRGAAFQRLGRTSALKAHSLPGRNADGEEVAGDNPIGRYAVHFHIVSGLSRDDPPSRFAGNVIVDSPKYGLVNHGAYVIAEDNVTLGVKGAHFFAENGSEIGAFRRNLAVYSRGSSDTIRAREDGVADFGHGGHGFWSQSPALTIEDNYAFHHSGAAYVVFAAATEMADGRQNVTFRGESRIQNLLAANLAPEVRAKLTGEFAPPTVVPFHFARNVGANSDRGLEVWNTNIIAEHDLPSTIEDSVFWGLGSAGIAMTYAVNTIVRDTTLIGADPVGCEGTCEGSIGVTTEGRTRNLDMENVRIAKFSTGVRLPMRGLTRIANSSFDNKYNLLYYKTQQPGRKTVLDGNTFAAHRAGGEDYHFLGGPLFHGDVSMLFETAPIIVNDPRFPGQSLFLEQQLPDAIPLADTDIPEFKGKTARQIYEEYGLAVGGVLAPDKVATAPGIGAHFGVGGRSAEMLDEKEMRERLDAAAQAGTGDLSYSSDHEEGYGVDCCNIHRVVQAEDGETGGWKVETVRDGSGAPRSRLTYIDAAPPAFKIDPRISLRIHPDDVKYGYVIEGRLIDENEEQTVRKVFENFVIADDGDLHLDFEYPDRSGNLFRQAFTVAVDPAAPKRGPDILRDLRASIVASGEPGQP